MYVPKDAGWRLVKIIVNLPEENANCFILSNTTVEFLGVVHLDDPHDDQCCNSTEPAQDEAQLAHELQG